jgi:Toastrack DUF4097
MKNFIFKKITDGKMKNNLFIKCLTILLLFSIEAQSQEVLQVVTKKIEKTLDFFDDYKLDIEGEKADVLVNTWNQQKVRVELELIAKHSDIVVAKKDIELIKYIIEKRGNIIFIQNTMDIAENDEKPRSSLHVHYIITIPEQCPLNLKNHFGNADINDLKKQVVINSEYCKIKLTNIEGDISIQTRFGDVVGVGLAGKVSILASRSDITLTRLTGSIDIQAKYGLIKIDADKSLIDLNIVAEKSDIMFLNPAVETYSFNLTAYYGKIDVPKNMEFNFKEKTPTINKAELNLPVNEGHVSIRTSFGNIVISKIDM